jgi:hypothetical protein
LNCKLLEYFWTHFSKKNWIYCHTYLRLNVQMAVE